MAKKKKKPEVQHMEQTLRAMLESLVDYTDELQIETLEGQTICVFEVSACKLDLGKIIGKQGRNIQAIRTILEGASVRDHIRYKIQVVED